VRTILLDADILVYECAHRAQTSIHWDEEATVTADFPGAQLDFRLTVRSIIQEVGADSVVVVLSEDDREVNFRREIWDGYKRKREGAKATPRPVLFAAIREWIEETYDPKIKHGIEGDDTIGILATLPSRADLDQVICSIDKDMLTVPGSHYNWRKPELGVFEVTEEEAHYNHMLQTLMGDSTDGYPGCPTIGAKRAAKVLADGATWERVVEVFESKGLTEADALIQARCARILQASDYNFETEEVILWEP